MDFYKMPKPPLGLQPRGIWIYHRCVENIEVMHRQVNAPEGYSVNFDLIKEWAEELIININELGGE